MSQTEDAKNLSMVLAPASATPGPVPDVNSLAKAALRGKAKASAPLSELANVSVAGRQLNSDCCCDQPAFTEEEACGGATVGYCESTCWTCCKNDGGPCGGGTVVNHYCAVHRYNTCGC